MKQRHVWVVEMWTRSGWQPCESGALNKMDAAVQLNEWRLGMPDDRFQLQKYTRSKGP